MKNLTLFFFLISFTTLQAADVRGFVFEKNTKEPLVGALVSLKNTTLGVVVELDGSFIIRNVPKGNQIVVCSFIGFETQEKTLVIASDTEGGVLQFDLSEQNTQLATVEISAKLDRESDISARRVEQVSPTILNTISARAIEISPDLTVANVLQRVSGVSLERSNNGDGRYAILRGMDKRYNYTLVNGIKIPSPDPYNRYVPLDIFPSDLLQRLEVNKALTPDMEGDAIGGVVNMVMKDAPDKKTVQANLATGYSQLFFDRPFKYFDKNSISTKSPADLNGAAYQAKISTFPFVKFEDRTPPPNIIGGLTLGNRFGSRKQLGVLVAASYQNTRRGSDGYFYETSIDFSNKPQIKNLRVLEYSTQQIRSGVNVKLDYQLAAGHSLRLYGLWLNLDEIQSRITKDTTYKLPARADIDFLKRSHYQRQNIANATLQGVHNFTKKLTVNWSAVYSQATNNVPDLAQQNLKVTSAGNRWQDMSRIWLDNIDNDLSAYLNVKYALTDFLDISAGGLYRKKNRENRFLSYQLRASGQIAADENDISKETYTVFNPLGIYVGNNNYTADENIAAGYGQFKFSIKELEIIGGVRIENTDQSYLTSLPKTETGYKGSQMYSDILPSLHFKYKLRDNQNVRLSYFSSISRPSYFEITPYNNSGSITEGFAEAGNPYLKRTEAQNIDLRFEHFGRGNDQIFAGVFYKKIKNPIEYALVDIPNTVVTVYQPNNFGTATNYGFEFVGTKSLRNIGFTTNYTFTISDITTPKTRNITLANGARTRETVQQSRPLQGQSRHVANISLFYKSVKSGFDAQLAWVFTGKRIVQVDRFVDLDYWQRDQQQLDFSIEKRVFKRFTLFGKAQNLLNTPYQVDILAPYPATDYPFPYQGKTDRIQVTRQTYGQFFLLGVRYKM